VLKLEVLAAVSTVRVLSLEVVIPVDFHCDTKLLGKQVDFRLLATEGTDKPQQGPRGFPSEGVHDQLGQLARFGRLRSDKARAERCKLWIVFPDASPKE
jgi:hypothetical protein